MAHGWEKRPCVYIMASERDGVLYIGVTSQLADRVSIHKQDLVEGFTKTYGGHRLVYYEMHETIDAAITRETRLKKWHRAWKVRLIQAMNPSGSISLMRRPARSSMDPLIGGVSASDMTLAGLCRGWPPSRP